MSTLLRRFPRPGSGLGLAAALLILAPVRAETPLPKLSLVVVFTVDQFRGDYPARFGHQFTGGLARLTHEGIVFPNGMQDHAETETAPGHSTILSGRDPAHTGIVSNTFGVADRSAPLLEVTGLGASPARFVGTALYDWMRAADPDARVLSVSRKDRGAILPVGRAKGAVFWYQGGVFTTSRYYADTLPPWVEAYNHRPWAAALAGTAWTPLLPDSAYSEPDSMAFENGGHDVTFPHRFPGTTDSVGALLPSYPWMDSLTLDFALEGVRQLALGRRSRPDLLAISLSATDYVGHAFGPDSKELHDQVLRLDRWLGGFLDSLDRVVPRARTLFVLTGDHGITSFPELAVAQGRPGGRVGVDSLLQALAADLHARSESVFDLRADAGLFSADVAGMARAGINVDSLSEALAKGLARLPGVTKAYTPKSLKRAPGSDLDAARWRRTLPDNFGWLVCGSIAPGYIWTGEGGWTTHGTTNPDDASVPIIFMGPGIHAGVSSTAARTVDIAPTLAALLGIEPGQKLDGQPLPEVLGKRR
jgi:hypothetical protein